MMTLRPSGVALIVALLLAPATTASAEPAETTSRTGISGRHTATSQQGGKVTSSVRAAEERTASGTSSVACIEIVVDHAREQGCGSVSTAVDPVRGTMLVEGVVPTTVTPTTGKAFASRVKVSASMTERGEPDDVCTSTSSETRQGREPKLTISTTYFATLGWELTSDAIGVVLVPPEDADEKDPERSFFVEETGVIRFKAPPTPPADDCPIGG